MCCQRLDQLLKCILSGCVHSYRFMSKDTTHHTSGLIRGVCLTWIPVKAIMTICEECIL